MTTTNQTTKRFPDGFRMILYIAAVATLGFLNCCMLKAGDPEKDADYANTLEAAVQVQAEPDIRLEGWMLNFDNDFLVELEEDKVVLDKARPWGVGHDQFSYIFPEGKLICMVRNPLAVIASHIKQGSKNPLLDGVGMIIPYIDGLCSPAGMVGSNANCIMDVKIKEPQGKVIFVRYEDLVTYPKREMERVYKFLGEPYFDHDFDNIENTCEELDVMYNNKFPHKGCGAIKPDLESYHEWIPEGLQKHIYEAKAAGQADGIRFIFDNFYGEEK